MFLNYYICLDSIGKCDAPLIYTNSCPLLDKVHRGWREKEEEEKKKENSEVCLWRFVSKLSVKARDACKGHNENGVCLVSLLSGWMSPDRKIVFRQEQLYPSISSQRTGSIKTETEVERKWNRGKREKWQFYFWWNK